MDHSIVMPNKQPTTTRDQSVLQQSISVDASSTVISSLQNLMHSIKKSDNATLAAKRFCLQNNLDFNMINPISQRIDMLLKVDKQQCFQKYTMRHINLNQQNKQNIYEDKQNQNKYLTIERPRSGLKSRFQSELNAGVMIYQRNRRLSEKSRKKAQKIKQQLEAKINKSLTFKPDINNLSKIVVNQIEETQGRQQFYERRKQEKILKINYLSQSKLIQEMKQCSFKPLTNQSRNSSIKSFSKSKTQFFDHLSKPKISDNKIDPWDNKCMTFHPKINQISQMIINGVPFKQRQQKYQIDRMMKLSQSKQIEKDQRSSLMRTSRLKSHRQSSKLISRRNIQKLPIGQYLYNQRINKQLSIQKIKQQIKPKSIKSNTKSTEMYQVNKFKSFYQIFKILDSNNDSIISASMLDTEGIPCDILILIAPLLAEMEQMNISLCQEQFIQALDKLYSTLNINQKNSFIKYGRNQGKNTSISQGYSFKPLIDQKSSILANNVRQFGTPGVSLYNFCQQRKSLLDKKLQERRRQKQNYQNYQCTFKPIINK